MKRMAGTGLLIIWVFGLCSVTSFPPVRANDHPPPILLLKAQEGLSYTLVAEGSWAAAPLQMTFLPDGSLLLLDELLSLSNNDEALELDETRAQTSAKICLLKTLRWNEQKRQWQAHREWKRFTRPISFAIVGEWFIWLESGKLQRQSWHPRDGLVGPVSTLITQQDLSTEDTRPTLAFSPDGWLYITLPAKPADESFSFPINQKTMRGGKVFRCRADGSQWHVYARGIGDKVSELAFSSDMQPFLLDFGHKYAHLKPECRLLSLLEEGEYMDEFSPPDRAIAEKTLASMELWMGILDPVKTWKHGPPNHFIYYGDDRMGEKLQGAFIFTDKEGQLLRAIRLQPNGCQFKVSEEWDVLKAMLPCLALTHLLMGPDGAIYVCVQRHNIIPQFDSPNSISGPLLYRLEWTGHELEASMPLRPLPIVAEQEWTDSNVWLDALASTNQLIRTWASSFLGQRLPSTRSELERIATDQQSAPRTRLQALIALQYAWQASDESLCIQWLEEVHPEMVQVAAQTLAWRSEKKNARVLEAFIKQLNHSNAQARRAVFLAAGKLGDLETIDALIHVYKFDVGHDRALLVGLIRAIEHGGGAAIERLASLAYSGLNVDREKVIEAFTLGRSRAFPQWLKNFVSYPHLTEAELLTLLNSIPYHQDTPANSPAWVIDWSNRDNISPSLKCHLFELLSKTDMIHSSQYHYWLFHHVRFDEDPRVRITALQKLRHLKESTITKTLLGCFAEDQRGIAEKREIVKLLGCLEENQASPFFVSLLKNPDMESYHETAMEALLKKDPKAALELTPDFMKTLDPSLQDAYTRLISAQSDGAKLIARLFVSGQLPWSILPTVAEGVRQHARKETSMQALYYEVLQVGLLSHDAPQQSTRLAQWLDERSHWKKGRTLFFANAELQCSRCHRKEDLGGEVGPDLKGVAKRLSHDQLIRSLIAPNHAIAEGYETHRIHLKAGQRYTGILKKQDDQAVWLLDRFNTRHQWKAQEVESIAKVPGSIMPAGGLSRVTFADFLHLLAYLRKED